MRAHISVSCGGLIVEMRAAREAVQSAAALTGCGGNAAIEQMAGFQDHQCVDMDVLADKLTSLGLNETQIIRLMNEVIACVETTIGKDNATKFRQILPAVVERCEATGRTKRPRLPEF
jgi:hypothetical protein